MSDKGFQRSDSGPTKRLWTRATGPSILMSVCWILAPRIWRAFKSENGSEFLVQCLAYLCVKTIIQVYYWKCTVNVQFLMCCNQFEFQINWWSLFVKLFSKCWSKNQFVTFSNEQHQGRKLWSLKSTHRPPPSLRLVPFSGNHVHVFNTIWPSYLIAWSI